MVFVTKVQPYSIINLDLGTERNAAAQGTLDLPDFTNDGSQTLQDWVANALTIISLDGGAATVKLGSIYAESITLSDGLKIEGVAFREIYWTNAEQSGKTAEIYVGWVD